ncbi:beta-mannosidase [Alicyclobacillus ferrooxydans]|uniref:Beta-mannosidase B n=1 Tax=Alicyclobacillus ferrooxydans TaxID=471514 RepID=A0A0P9EEU0_9BACL|nr:glycoside hydrolase family 2 protein [Alicyclobacillus ferrooxydans]KPV40855.1 glycoside hydrolase [Alicyclobacillus ferrooxydans]
MMRFDLGGTWILSEPTTQLKLECVVPGSVFYDLLRQQKIDDPYYRFNEEEAIEISEKTYTYTRRFTLTDEILNSDSLFLVCEGLDTLADVYLNGIFVAHTENMHRTFEWEVHHLVHPGDNEIRVLFNPSVSYIREANRKNPIWGQSDTIEGFTQLRKAHYMFGWDWGPKIPDAGIFRPIYLAGYRTARLTEVQSLQFHNEKDVRVQIDADIDWCSNASLADGTLSVAITLIHPSGHQQSKMLAVTCRNVSVYFDLDNPQLWWPNGYGNQPLYCVEVRLLSSSQESDSKEVGVAEVDCRKFHIGLRTLTVARENDNWGESFKFVINGVPIFAKGANYIPEDNLLGRRTDIKTRRLFEDCVEANFNLIRVWGGGFYPDDGFYDLADEMGLIVWQDFMYACGAYRLTPEFEANIRAESEDVLRRIRHHAALGLICGNNEMEQAWCDWDFPKTDELKADYLRHFEGILPELCARLAPQTFYWPASPSSGGGFDNPNAENRGDVHYWEVWHGLKPFTEYRKHYFRFCSEFGFQSFPSMKTIESFTLPEDRNVFSYVMEKHQKNNAANGRILFYLAENFRYPKDLDSLVYVSQVLQAEAIKYGVEHWRRNLGRCMGSIYWQLNDCWPVASWSSIDYYGRWKALHYFAKRFYQPVLLSAAETATSAQLYVTNDTLSSVDGIVRWALRRLDGSVIEEGERVISVPPLTAIEVADLDFSTHLSDIHARRRTYLTYELVVQDELVDGSTVLFEKAKHVEFEAPEITTEVEETEDMFIIRLSARGFAKYVELELKSADARFNNNYFDITPGIPRVVQLEKRTLSRSLTLAEICQELRIRSLFDTYSAPSAMTQKA